MEPFEDSNLRPEAGNERDFYALPLVRTTAPEHKVEGSVLIKMSVGAVVMMAFVAVVSIRVMLQTHGEKAKIEPAVALLVMFSSAAVGALIGGLLALKDRVQRKLEKGERVSYGLRLIFGAKEVSLALWIGVTLFICLIGLPILLSLLPF